MAMYHIEVTKYDIQNGGVSCNTCPIARAITRRLRDKGEIAMTNAASVGDNNVMIVDHLIVDHLKHDQVSPAFELPEIAKDFIKKYDRARASLHSIDGFPAFSFDIKMEL